MRQRLNHFHKGIRKELKEQYFRQRRTELLVYRQKQALKCILMDEGEASCIDRYGWRGIVLEKKSDQAHRQMYESSKCDIDFQINVQSLEDAEYYLNTILQQANLRCFEATIYLLGKLTSAILRPVRRLSLLQQKNQTNLVYMILTHTHNLLQSNINHELRVRKNCKQKRYLQNLFAEDYRALLAKQDSIIIGQLINIAEIICNSYKILPNYELIKYLLCRVTIKQNLQIFFISIDVIRQKIQNLLMNFIVLYKPQQRTLLKQINVPHQQIIYDFNAYIEFNLTNLYEFIKENDHPFDYLAISDSLSYYFTLQIQIINKFRHLAIKDMREFEEEDYLVKESLIILLEKIIRIHEEKSFSCNHFDEVAIVLQQIAIVMFWYLLEAKGQSSRIHGQKACLQTERYGLESLGSQDSQLIGLVLLIKIKFRQLSRTFE